MTPKRTLIAVVLVLVALPVTNGLLLRWGATRVAEARRTEQLAAELESELFKLALLTHEWSMFGTERQNEQLGIQVAHTRQDADAVIALQLAPRDLYLRQRIEINSRQLFDQFDHLLAAETDPAALETTEEWKKRAIGSLLVSTYRLISDVQRLQEVVGSDLTAARRQASSLVILSTVISTLFVCLVVFLLLNAVSGLTIVEQPAPGEVERVSRPGFALSMLAMAILLGAVVFVCDIAIERGVAVGVAYVAVVGIAYLSADRRVLWTTAAACVMLTVAGMLLSFEGELTWQAATDRALSIFAIGVTALMCSQAIRSQRRLLKSRHALEELNRELEQRVGERTQDLGRRADELAVTNRTLHAAESRLQMALDAAHAGIWSWNVRDDQLYLDDRMRRMFGFGPDEGLERLQDWIQRIHPADRDVAELAMRHALDKSSGGFNVEFRVPNARGQTRTTHAQGIVEGDAAGEAEKVTGLCVDITDRKRMEAELVAKNQDLETLLYVTSHDLREPLRAVQNFSRMVVEDYRDQLDDMGQDLLMRIERAAERLDHLINDILTLSRAQRMTAPTERMDGASLVAEALEALEERIRESHATVRVADSLPTLCVDRRWAVQAVFNLVANALKFTRDGNPPEIEIDAYECPSHHGLPGALPTAGLVIRDRGPGVAPDQAQRIFQLFQRAVGREVEGTGAGLAIVRQIAERHGGTVWVQPREGGGSEFFITFSEGQVAAT